MISPANLEKLQQFLHSWKQVFKADVTTYETTCPHKICGFTGEIITVPPPPPSHIFVKYIWKATLRNYISSLSMRINVPQSLYLTMFNYMFVHLFLLNIPIGSGVLKGGGGGGAGHGLSPAGPYQPKAPRLPPAHCFWVETIFSTSSKCFCWCPLPLQPSR